MIPHVPSCPRGLAICHHTAALCLFAHHICSATDNLCLWNMRNSKVENTKTVKEIYPTNFYLATQNIPNENCNHFKESIEKLGVSTGILRLLKPEPHLKINQNKLLILIEDMIFSNKFYSSKNKKNL